MHIHRGGKSEHDGVAFSEVSVGLFQAKYLEFSKSFNLKWILQKLYPYLSGLIYTGRQYHYRSLTDGSFRKLTQTYPSLISHNGMRARSQ